MPVFNNILAGAAGSGGAASYEIKRSLRFNDDDEAYLSKNVGSAGDQRRMTFSFWIKRHTISSSAGFAIFAQDYATSPSNHVTDRSLSMLFDSDKLELYDYGASDAAGNSGSVAAWTGGKVQINSEDVLFRDPSAWHSVIFAIDTTQSTAANRCKVWINGVQCTMSGYPVQNSYLSWGQARNHYIGIQKTNGSFTRAGDFSLADVHFIDGQQLSNTDFGEFDDTGVWNPKKFSGTYGSNGFHLDFSDNSSNAALGTDAAGSNNWTVNNLSATGVGVGTAGWLNKIGSPQSTWDSAATTSRVSSGTSWSTNGNNNTLHFDTQALGTYTITFTKTGGGNEIDFETSSSSGSGYSRVTNSSSTITISSTSSSQTHSYNRYVRFSGSGSGNVTFSIVGTAQGTDLPGIDSLLDSPSNYEADSGNNGGNYCSPNPLHSNSNVGFSNGNLDLNATASGWFSCYSTMGISSGKFYWEATPQNNSAGALNSIQIGLAPADSNIVNSNPGGLANGYTWGIGGQKRNSNSGSSYGSAAAAGDTVMVAFDADNGKIWWGKNGTWFASGNPATGANAAYTSIPSDTYIPTFSFDRGRWIANFGARPFAYTPPSGFKSLCTQNLDDPLIAKGSAHFLAKTYSGNGSTQSISTGFSPDLVWLKSRQDGEHHGLFDTQRGPLYRLASDYTYASTLRANTLTSFNSDGFSLGSAGEYNGANNEPHIAWAWDGGDLVTNSTYNQDRTWSDGVTLGQGNFLVPATSAFDGNPATSAAPYDTSGGGGANPSITVTFSPGLAYTSSVKVERQNGNASNVTVSMNGGTAINSAFQAYTTLATGSGTLNSITVTNTGSSNTCGISRIEVDGKVLVDKGVIPVGSLNSSLYNQSQTWSNGVSTTRSSNPATQGFDGNNATAAVAPASTPLTITFSGGLTVNSKIEGNGLAPNILINEGLSDETSVTVGAGLQTIYSGSITIQTLKLSYPSNSNAGCFNLLKVDGKVLVDSGVSLSGLTQYPTHASKVTANPTAGFSIATYTGSGANTNFAHNLNAAPQLVIVKTTTDGNVNWTVWHEALAGTEYLTLNTSNDKGTIAAVWNSTAPTSTVVHVGSDVGTNKLNDDYLCLAWAPVAGYSAFGSYTGNGSSDGPFVYTGFRPAFILAKGINDAEDWYIRDTARSPFNEVNKSLRPNDAGSEYSGRKIDILSNGFKIRDSDSQINESGKSYLYACFAENPFKTARAR